MTYDNDDCTIGLALLILVIIVTGIILAIGYNAYTVATTTPNGIIVAEYEIVDICLDNSEYNIIVKTSNTTYETWDITVHTPMIRAEKSNIVKIQKPFETSYIISYNVIRLCK